MAGKRGRPTNVKKAQDIADRIWLKIAREQALTIMNPGRENPFSGQKLKGQRRAPRSLTKKVLLEIVNEWTSMHPNEKLSPRSVERYLYQYGPTAKDRIAAELTARLRGKKLINSKG